MTTTTTTTVSVVATMTREQRRAHDCPVCEARTGEPCRSSRRTSLWRFTGSPMLREHADRINLAR